MSLISRLLLASMMLSPLAAIAAQCTATIDSTDSMTFTATTLQIPKSCKNFELTLRHTGQLPINVMGDNLVLSKANDMAGIVQDGTTSGSTENYVKPDDERVIAHTGLIGGGEHTSVTIRTELLSADQEYVFFCSFPGHSSMMKGIVNVIR